MITYYKAGVLLIWLSAFLGCKKQSDLGVTKTPVIKDPIAVVSGNAGDTIIKEVAPVIPSKILPKDTTTKYVVVLGSSTAAGWGASRWDSTWIGRLRSKLDADSMRVNIVNFGEPGYVTYQGMPSGYAVSGRPQPDNNRNITRALTFHPVLVIINFPTNDISNNYSNSEILNNYKVLAELLKAQNVEYIITGTQPRNFSSLEQRQRLKNLNDLMEPVYGNHYNNYLEKLSTPSFEIQGRYSAGDGVHLNNQGHKVLYESFMAFPLFRKVAGY
jgi:acyl-CoA thioesterase-1